MFLCVSVCCRPVTISEAQRSAPEQVFDPGHEKRQHEMTQAERKALRGAIKDRRRKKIYEKVVSVSLFGHHNLGCS